MAKKTAFTASKNTGMVLVVSYFTLFVVNTLVTYLANMFFPQFVVLGTQSMDMIWSLLHSMMALTVVGTFAIPFAHEFENMRKKMLTSNEWMALYAVINIVALWVISRFSDQFGLGLSAWYVVVALALVLDVAQGIAMMAVEKMKA